MNYLLFIAGVLIIGIVLTDVFVTTLAPRGTGLITERVRAWIWKFFLWVSGGKGTNKLLNYAGMFTLIFLLIGWLFALWLGNALLYISDEDSVIDSTTNIVANSIDKAYFLGYVLSTMGLGDFAPNGQGWKIYTSIISFSGFIIITLGVTYLVPILSAEMSKRQTSVYIHSLGTSPDDILLNAWNGKDFSRLSKHLKTISQNILQQSQNHVAYPVLHNFHSHLRRESIYLNLSALDEAVTILLLYIPGNIKPHKQDLYPLRYAITDYLHTLKSAFIEPSKNEPAPIQLSQLKKYGIPLKQENEEIRRKTEKLRLRRKLLLGMIENDGWDWNNIFMETAYNDYDIDHLKKSYSEERKNYQKDKHK